MSSKSSRNNQNVSLEILAQHGRQCPYCDEIMRVPPRGTPRRNKQATMPTRDHVIPKSIQPGRGVIFCCSRCNADKKNYLLEDWYVRLRDGKDLRAQTVFEFMSVRQFP